MRKKNQLHIKEAINNYFIQNGMGDKLLELKIFEIWKEEFGKAITGRTERVSFCNGKLFVYLTSSVLKQELLYALDVIKEKLNKRLPEPVINEVIIR